MSRYHDVRLLSLSFFKAAKKTDLSNRLTRHSEDTTTTVTTLTIRHPTLMESNCMTLMTQITTTLNLNTNPTIRINNITFRTHSLPRKYNQLHFLPPSHKICAINKNSLRRRYQQTTSHRMPALALSTTRSPLHVRSRILVKTMRW